MFFGFILATYEITGAMCRSVSMTEKFSIILSESMNQPAVIDYMADHKTGRVADEVTGEVAGEEAGGDTPHDTPQVAPQVIAVLKACKNASSRTEIQDALGLADREHFRKRYLLPALDAGLIERAIQEKPKSKNQKYLLTKKGETFLKQTEEGSK
jgi:ATP-dependent DNA helicase RecG